jgi:hypothetical protein
MKGVLVALVGLTFLLGSLGALSAKVVGLVWPTLVILIGVMMTCGKSCKCCATEPKG